MIDSRTMCPTRMRAAASINPFSSDTCKGLVPSAWNASSTPSNARRSVALPLADLSTIDTALRQSDDALREALKSVRAADVGRDLSRRSTEQGQRLLRAADDRSAAMMLRSANPVVAAHLLTECDLKHAARILEFLPI